MRYLSLFCCALFLICSCRQRPHQPHSSDKKNDSIANEKALWHYCDSVHMAFVQSIREPSIDTFHHEIYRYWVDLAFYPDFIFRVESVQGKWILTSRWIQDECENCHDGVTLIVRGKKRTVPYGSVADSSIQELTAKQWTTFINLLEGSYYRRMQDPGCEDGILDGNSLILEAVSRTKCMRQDTLHYYHVGIHVPREGSFKEACKYLMSISLLLESKKWRRAMLRIM